MEIRKVEEADKEKLRELLYGLHISYKKTYSNELQDLEKYKDDEKIIDESISEYFKDPKYLMYIAEEDDNPVGYIVGNIEEKPHRVLDKRGYVQDWFVVEAYRGKKVGKALFDKLAEDFKQMGCKAITLDTFSENKTALDIYHNMGFRERLVMLIKKLG